MYFFYLLQDRIYWAVRRARGRIVCAEFYLVDRLPWFARKRLMNLLLGRDSFTDFMQTDKQIRTCGAFLCVKW